VSLYNLGKIEEGINFFMASNVVTYFDINELHRAYHLTATAE
jgi:hypothetical protein